MVDKKGTKTINKKSDLDELADIQEEVEVVNDEIEGLKKKVEECENNYKRALADYQNLQRRVQEDRINWIQAANKELLLKLLPVLDTLMLAHKHLDDKGLELSIQQFLEVLEKEGVKKIETAGREFDPHTMEAVEIVDPSASSGQEGKVVEEVRAGYTLYDKVIRPAQVKVGKGSI